MQGSRERAIASDCNKRNYTKYYTWFYILVSIILFQYFHRNYHFLKCQWEKKMSVCLLSVTKLTINPINSSSLGWKTYLKSFGGKYLFMIINHFLLNSIWTQISIKILRWALFYNSHAWSTLSRYRSASLTWFLGCDWLVVLLFLKDT